MHTRKWLLESSRVNGPPESLLNTVESNDYIDGLRIAIQKLHGCDSRHAKSVPVTEEFQGRILGQGQVQFFELIGHPKAKRCYAWTHPEGDQNQKERFVAILELPPVYSAKSAVQVAIINELKEQQSN